MGVVTGWGDDCGGGHLGVCVSGYSLQEEVNATEGVTMLTLCLRPWNRG